MTDNLFSFSNKRVWVTGHRGMVGSALVRRLQQEDCTVLTSTRQEVDLRRQAEVERWMSENKPDVVLLAAAKVGGIQANDQYPADFIYDNLMIESNVIEAARVVGVEKLVLLGSTCIYPKFAEQPINEDSLLTGPLEPTNQWYAIAKIAGIKLCQAYRIQHGCDFISVQPTNLYGPGDNYDLNSSHVLPALLRKAHEAKSNNEPTMTVWGSGTPMREFLHVDDLADAVIHVTQHYSGMDPINIGSGKEVSIKELALLAGETAGFKGTIEMDATKPDGTPRKLADTKRLRDLGWSRARSLKEGMASTYQDFLRTEAPRSGS